MTKKRNKRIKEKGEIEENLKKRLDALIRLLVELNKRNNKSKFSDAIAARILKSTGLAPIEIAKIFGKKSASDIAPFLYSKKKKK